MEDPTQKYISRAIDLAEAKDDELTDDDLADIALELGLTEDDLARVEQAIDDHVERGRGYLRHQMWDDAIRELREAAALAPRRVPIQLALADALAGRGEATGYPDDSIRAGEIARNVLEVDPGNDEAYRLLARLEGEEPPPPRRTTRETSTGDHAAARGVLLVVAGATTALLVGVGVFVGVLSLRSAPPEPVPQPPPTPLVEVPEPETPDELPPPRPGDSDLPVEFVAGDHADVLTFDHRKSRLAVYQSSAYYRLWGVFEITGDVEVERIDVRLQLLDEDGEVVKADSFKAWDTHEATLRRGDIGPWDHLLEATAEAKSARLSVTLVESVPARGEYAEPRPIEPEWMVKPPEHLKLEIRERKAAVSKNDFMDGGFFKAEWEFHNVGESPIRQLKCEVRFLDANGQQIGVTRRIITFSSHPPLLAGEVFVEAEIEKVSDDYDSYEIAIVEIE